MTSLKALITVGLFSTALGCPQPAQDPPRPAVDETVRMPFDMNTNLPGDTPLVIEIPLLEPWASVDEFTREELPSWRESMRVVRWPSREPIEGRWVFSNTLPLSFTFEPTGRLPVGWYAMQVNFGTIVVPRGTAPESAVRQGGAGQTLDDGWTTARFHVGSLPIGSLRGRVDSPRDGRDGGGWFGLGFSEQIEFEHEIPSADLLRVTVNGVPIHCEPFWPTIQAGRFLGASWTCETPTSEGTVRAELMPLTGVSLSVRYGGDGGRPSWIGPTDAWLGGPLVDDSIFLEEGL